MSFTNQTNKLKKAILVFIGLVLNLAFATEAFALAAYHKTFADDKNPGLRVLFIGNSILFVGETPEVFVSLVRSANPKAKLKVQEVSGPAYSLQDHLDFGLAEDVIKKNGPWDIIVIQQNTYDMLIDPRQTLGPAKLLVEMIRAVKAKPVFYETMGTGTMQYYLQQHRSAQRVCKKLHLEMLPVASALYDVHQKKPELKLFRSDMNHYNMTGVYAASCVCFAKLLKKSPVGLSASLKDNTGKKWLVKLRSEDAKLIQEAADAALKTDAAMQTAK